MSDAIQKNGHTVFRIVLTGGPCGGKTTGQARLSSFFESLGWKVYRVPETATILLGGGVKFMDMNDEEVFNFQKNLMETMMHVEKTFFDLADSCPNNCIVICDRGVMDATAYMSPEQWQRMKTECDWNEVDLRDNRYHLVVHLVSAANGAEAFYTTQGHATRHEGIEFAKTLDKLTSQAWVGHPYFHVIDNSTDFERKLMRMISNVCNRFGIEADNRLAPDTRKRKYLIRSLPDDSVFPVFRDFIVIHDYLVTPLLKQQARLRKRGEKVRWSEDQGNWDSQSGHWTYTHTIRKPEINGQSPEVRMAITHREYEILVAQRDTSHHTIYKRRRCFLWNTQYFQMDIYLQPCHPRCQGLILLETYTNSRGDIELPPFLNNEAKEVTSDPYYSMFNLSSVDPQQTSSGKEKLANADMKNGPLAPPDVTLTSRPSDISIDDGVPDSLK